MTLLNALLGAIFDVLMAPFSALPPWVGLVVVSLATAIFVLIVFRRTAARSRRHERTKQVPADAFGNDPASDSRRAMPSAPRTFVRRCLDGLRLALVRMLWILPPLVLLLAQLQSHYGHAGLEPGLSTLLEVEIAGEPTAPPAIELRVPQGIVVETAPLWAKVRSEISWRLRADQAGHHQVELVLPDGKTLTKRVLVSDRPGRRSPARVEAAFWNQLRHPAEDPIPPATGITEIRIGYADANVSIFGFSLHWTVWFFILLIAFAFTLRTLMRVVTKR